MEITLNMHGQYFSIALDSFNMAEELEDQRKEIMASQGHHNHVPKPDETARLMSIIDKIGNAAITSVVFSALCTEALINSYAINNFSRSFFKNYLDKLNVKSKWVIIPRLVTGNEVDVGSPAMQALWRLIDTRNKLTHFKTIQKDSSEFNESDFINIEDAQNGIEAIRKAVGMLKNIDANYHDSWLDFIE
jgi:hypothetical protein